MKLNLLNKIIVLSIIILLVLAGCGAPAAETPTEEAPSAEVTEAPAGEAVGIAGGDPDTAVMTLYADIDTLDPHRCSTDLGRAIVLNLYEHLVRPSSEDPDEMVPFLAESWEHSDDFTSWTFHIRENAKFSDGTPVDATAVKASYVRYITIQSGVSYVVGQFIPDPENQITVVDEHTLQFTSDVPIPLLLNALGGPLGPYIINPAAVEEHEADGDMAAGWFNTNAAGSGPYMLEEYAPNERYILSRNENWWGWDANPHPFETVIFQIVPEPATRRSLLENGDVDFAWELAPDDWVALQDNPDVIGYTDSDFGFIYITIGKEGYLADPRVRQALNYAFDAEGYTNGLRRGFGQPLRSFLPEGMKCFDPDVFTYTFDLEKARALLEEAGVPMDGSVTWDFRGPEGFGFLDMGVLLQSALAELDINLTVQEMDIGTYLGWFYGNDTSPERPDLMVWGWNPDYNDPTNLAWVLLHSDAAGAAGGNGGLYANSDVDRLINEAFTVVNDDEQLCSIYEELQNVITEQDPPWVYVWQKPNEMHYRADIGGWVANPIYLQTVQFQQVYRITE